ncbi:hypothetical protein B484DRAFT_389871 [Ochromonadaceae sp. CCMP2298]|nr:hypothetical protein B484DRAFT_389871 [Ochromonadaceae sp. CCMP2298]
MSVGVMLVAELMVKLLAATEPVLETQTQRERQMEKLIQMEMETQTQKQPQTQMRSQARRASQSQPLLRLCLLALLCVGVQGQLLGGLQNHCECCLCL